MEQGAGANVRACVVSHLICRCFEFRMGHPPQSVHHRWPLFQKSMLLQRTAGCLSDTMLGLFKSNILNKCVCMGLCMCVCPIKFEKKNKKKEKKTVNQTTAQEPNTSRWAPFFLRLKITSSWNHQSCDKTITTVWRT